MGASKVLSFPRVLGLSSNRFGVGWTNYPVKCIVSWSGRFVEGSYDLVVLVRSSPPRSALSSGLQPAGTRTCRRSGRQGCMVWAHLGVSVQGGPQNGPKYILIPIIIQTPKTGPLISGNLHLGYLFAPLRSLVA